MAAGTSDFGTRFLHVKPFCHLKPAFLLLGQSQGSPFFTRVIHFGPKEEVGQDNGSAILRILGVLTLHPWKGTPPPSELRCSPAWCARIPRDAHTDSRLPQTTKPIKPEGFTPKKGEFPAKPGTAGRTFTELQHRRPGLVLEAHDGRQHPRVRAVAGPAHVLHRPAHGEDALVPERLLQLSKRQAGGSTAASWGRHKTAPWSRTSGGKMGLRVRGRAGTQGAAWTLAPLAGWHGRLPGAVQLALHHTVPAHGVAWLTLEGDGVLVRVGDAGS